MFGIPDFLVKFFAKKVEKQIGLTEDTSMDTPWWKRLSTWSHIVALLVGLYGSVSGISAGDFGHALPAIPAWLLTLLSGIGLLDNHIGPSSQ